MDAACALLVTFAESFAATCVQRGLYFHSTGRLGLSPPANLWLALVFGLLYAGAADAEAVRIWTRPDWLKAYEFRSDGRTVVVLRTRATEARRLDVPDGFHAQDLMGNPLEGRHVSVTDVPMYLVSD